MANRKRNILLRFRVTPEERDIIEQKMIIFGTSNMEAYLRKMSLDGYVVKLDLPELQQMISLLRRTSNNVNQIAKHANTMGQVYRDDMAYIIRGQERLWDIANEILNQLTSIG